MKCKILISVFVIVPFFLFAESRPVVQIDPVINLSGQPWLDSVCAAATDSVSLTLGLLGRFETKNESREDSQDQTLFHLKQRAEEGGFDNIIFGSCSVENSVYIISMSAYDLSKNEITYSGQVEVQSIYDTFDAVDKITYQTIDGFSGIHVTYSSLTLIPPETGEPFRFTIDGVSLADGVFSVDKMPSGMHELAVFQERPLGLYETSHEIEIIEGQINKYEIPLPSVSPLEREVFREVDKELIWAGLNSNVPDGAEVDALERLLKTDFYQKYRQGLIIKYREKMKENRLGSFDSDKNKTSSLQKRSFWSNENPKNVAIFDFSFSARFNYLMKSEEELAAESVFVPFRRTITVDGKGDDWRGVSTYFKDFGNDLGWGSYLKDHNETGPGQDLIEVGCTFDNSRLYFMMKLDSKKYRNDRDYNVNITGQNLYRLHAGTKESVHFNAAFVRDKNWDNSHWFDGDDVGLKGRWGDILEMSITQKYMLKSIESITGLMTVEFHIQRNSANWQTIDNYSVQMIIPSLYYSLRADLPE